MIGRTTRIGKTEHDNILTDNHNIIVTVEGTGLMSDSVEDIKKMRQELLERMATNVAACADVQDLKIVIISILTKLLA